MSPDVIAKIQALHASVLADEADGGLLSKNTIRLTNELVVLIATERRSAA